jgi:hypothetical protein
MGILYATREQVLQSLEVLQSSYAGSLIDAKIEWASRSIEYQTHRRFYPERRTIARDWPDMRNGYTWEVDLGDQELISLELVNSGGTDITASCFPRRLDDLDEPPYSLLQVDLSSQQSFAAGTTFQRSLTVTGLFSGDKDTDTSIAGGLLASGINSSVQNPVLLPSLGLFTVGIGSLLLCGTERMVVQGRQMLSSGETLSGDVADRQAATVITSTGASNFAQGETILVDGERMRVNDVAGDGLIVSRAWDGTSLTTHSSGATIYALRQFIVTRGVLGSTAASHSTSDPVYVHQFPVNEWCIAETVCALEQNAGAYARTIGTGSSAREAVGAGLEDIRNAGYVAYGRKGRSAAV